LRRFIDPVDANGVSAMKAICLLIFAFCLLPSSGFVGAQTPIRLAVVELVGDERGETASLLRSLARQSQSPSFELIDEELVRSAARGAGYAGSLNLSRDEARALGQSLGCDFYLLGKVLLTRRAASGEQFYFESLLGLFVVEARTGALALFAFDRAPSGGEAEARARLEELVKRAWKRSADAIVSARERRLAEIGNFAPARAPLIEVFSDEAAAPGVEQPVFYQRLKPAYTEEADLAGVTATVELEAVFGEDGKVGEVEITRWAGFGLDESALSTVRQLRFKPAEREGKRVTIRGLVRYNFRRPIPQAASPRTASPAEIERIRRSLRDALSPKQSTIRNRYGAKIISRITVNLFASWFAALSGSARGALAGSGPDRFSGRASQSLRPGLAGDIRQLLRPALPRR
jgi:TonB family protein